MSDLSDRLPGVKSEVVECRAPRADLKASDFEWHETLGEGSYSTVVRATLLSTGVTYAVKVMDKMHIVRSGKIRYVKNERFILDQLESPGVGRLFFTFQDAASLYMGLELCAGGELFHQIKRGGGGLPEGTARFYAAEMVLTLEHLHALRIVHRDLKPENVLLTAGGHLKLVDFGSAKVLEGSPVKVLAEGDTGAGGGKKGTEGEEGRASSFVGTAEYVPPEVLEGKAATPAADLWALGCIIFQMLHGKPPFKGETEYLTMKKVQGRDFQFPADFPAVARDLVGALLAEDPAARLGAGGPGLGMEALKAHAFFSGVEWEGLREHAAPPFLGPAGREKV